MQLDLIDRKILYYLDENARESQTQLAKRLRISKSVLQYRIERLKKEKIIIGSFAEINNSYLNYLNFRIFIKLSHNTHKQYLNLLDKFAQDPNVMWLAGVSGKWDIDIIYMTQEIAEFENFYEALLTEYNSIIENHQVSLLSRVNCYSKDYLLDKFPTIRRRTDFVAGKKKVEVDKFDIAILRLLSKDAQISILKLANDCNLSINTTKKRIKNLEKEKVITGYRIFYDTQKIGLLYYKLHVLLRNYTKSDLSAMQEWFFSHPFVIYNNRYINAEHFEVELHVKNDIELEDLKCDLQNKFGHLIKDVYEIKFKDLRVYRAFPLK